MYEHSSQAALMCEIIKQYVCSDSESAHP